MKLVVITNGPNTLPCLVEAYRLCCTLRSEQDGTKVFPHFLVVDSNRERVDLVHRLLLKRIREDEKQDAAVPWSWVELNDATHEPYQPDAIYQKVAGALKSYGNASAVYFPYAGGTKAMAVHSFEAVRDTFQTAIRSGYLSARTHQVESRGGFGYYSAGLLDERTAWNLSLGDLALLHGVEELRSATPEDEISHLAGDLLAQIIAGGYTKYLGWLIDEWKRPFRRGYKETRIEELRPHQWPRCSIPWFQPSSSSPQEHKALEENWEKLTERLSAKFGGDKAWSRKNGKWEVHIDIKNKDFIIPLYRLLDNKFLELYAYRCLRELLPRDCAVAHSFECRDSRRGRTFELDVVAVLGYQLVAVSCVFSNRQSTCKDKAFEVLHRARQLGGEQARGVVLCLLDRNAIADLESDLEVDTGDLRDSRQIRFFGKETLEDASSPSPRFLKNAFHGFLKQLGWRKFQPEDP